MGHEELCKLLVQVGSGAQPQQHKHLANLAPIWFRVSSYILTAKYDFSRNCVLQQISGGGELAVSGGGDNSPPLPGNMPR